MAVGTWLSANPSFARTITDAGHELGNHTWSHPTLSELAEADVVAEIVRCRDLLQKLTGSRALPDTRCACPTMWILSTGQTPGRTRYAGIQRPPLPVRS
jgi:peptidoglycan/xylan/chitin deacetylase (PgdA/CDA1 family)